MSGNNGQELSNALYDATEQMLVDHPPKLHTPKEALDYWFGAVVFSGQDDPQTGLVHAFTMAALLVLKHPEYAQQMIAGLDSERRALFTKLVGVMVRAAPIEAING